MKQLKDMLRKFLRWIFGLEDDFLIAGYNDDFEDTSNNCLPTNSSDHPIAQTKVKVLEITQGEQVIDVVQALQHEEIVSLNTSLLDDEQKRDVLSYLRGATYALDGMGMQIGTQTYLYTPKSVHVSHQKQLEKLPSSGSQMVNLERSHALI